MNTFYDGARGGIMGALQMLTTPGGAYSDELDRLTKRDALRAQMGKDTANARKLGAEAAGKELLNTQAGKALMEIAARASDLPKGVTPDVMGYGVLNASGAGDLMKALGGMRNAGLQDEAAVAARGGDIATLNNLNALITGGQRKPYALSETGRLNTDTGAVDYTPGHLALEQDRLASARKNDAEAARAGLLAVPSGNSVYSVGGLAASPGGEILAPIATAPAAQGGGTANLQEWAAYQQMTPEQRREYLTMKRANPYLNLGGEMVQPDPTMAGQAMGGFERTVSPDAMPETKAAQAVAVSRAEAAAKREATAFGQDELLRQAKSILTNTEEPPTGSGAGALIDSSAGAIGMTPAGAGPADQLEIIAGNLVSKVPRMEGPQSNYDVENYKKMAGDLGNRNLPIQRRLYALKTLEDLNKKYANLNQVATPSAVPSAPRPGDIEDGHRFLGGDPSDPRSWEIAK